MSAHLFPAGSLRLQRAISEANLPEACTVTRPGGWIPDEHGGGVFADPTTFTFPCRRYPLGRGGSETERLIAEQLRDDSLEVLVFPLGESLTASDAASIEGAEYDVVRRIPDGSYATQSRAIIRPRGPSGGIAA